MTLPTQRGPNPVPPDPGPGTRLSASHIPGTCAKIAGPNVSGAWSGAVSRAAVRSGSYGEPVGPASDQVSKR